MDRQTVLKLPGTELRYGMLDDWHFWLLVLAVLAVVYLWRGK